jgi:hypothetical protein
MKKPCSETHHRESSSLVPAAPSVVALAIAERCSAARVRSAAAQTRRALASCAPFRLRIIRDGRLRREPDTVQFLRLAKDENQVVVDKTS